MDTLNSVFGGPPRMVLPVTTPTTTTKNIINPIIEHRDPMIRYKLVVEENGEKKLDTTSTTNTVENSGVGTTAFAFVPPGLIPLRDETMHRISILTRYLDSGLIRNRNSLMPIQNLVKQLAESRDNYPSLFMLHIPSMMGAPCYSVLNAITERVIRRRKKLRDMFHVESDFIQRKKLHVFIECFTIAFRPIVRFKVREIFKKTQHARFTEAEKEQFKTRYSTLTREWKIKIVESS